MNQQFQQQPQQLAALKCPNCGGGLGAPTGQDYICQYCQHRSRLQNQAAPEEALAATLARFAARRNERLGVRADAIQRRREAFLAKRRENAIVMFGIGGLFGLIGLVIAAVQVKVILENGAVGPLSLFLVLWSVMTGGAMYLGYRYHRAGAREKRLRANGVPGRGWVLSYRDSGMMVDGNSRMHLVLRVELPNRAPYDVKLTDNVPRMDVLGRSADLPIFVDAGNPNDVMVDWWT